MTPAPQPPKPELLAPAGSWESFLAGLEAGADAFYLGLREWSARGRAKNFSLEDLRRLIPLAHTEGRRVYVALNTLLKEEEVPRAADAVWELLCLEADALILQDLGLWHLCRRVFPEARLHASTQMSVHNSAGVRQLERMGFSRVVLARECTLSELRAIRAASTLPLEVFVHGALCYAVSGQCLASTALAGGSANRGWCAQPCRWNYRTAPGMTASEQGESHPFSPSDLCLLERVPELAEAGVAALKIEGRLKGPEYVAAVVRAYRSVLDARPDQRADAAAAGRELLEAAAGRPATEGYADHPRPRQVLLGGGRPALGTRVGRVLDWTDGTAVISASLPLHRGDRLRIASGPRGEGVAMALRAFRREGGPAGDRLRVPCPSPVARGASVYRVKTAGGEELEQGLARRARALGGGQGGDGGFPVRASARLEAEGLRVRAACGPAETEFLAPMSQFPAKESALTAGTLATHLGRLGGTRFRLVSLAVEGELPPVVLPPSALKEARRRLAAELEEALAREAGARRARVAALRAEGLQTPQSSSVRLWARAEDPAVLRAALALDEPVHRVVAALDRECWGARRELGEGSGVRERTVWELPAWISEDELPVYRRNLEILAGEGFREVMVTNLGHLELLGGLPLSPLAGRELHALNGWAAAGLREQGCTAFTPSPETDGENLRALAAGGWPLRPVVYAYGNLPLFVTRLDPAAVLPRGAPAVTVDGRSLAWAPAPESPSAHDGDGGWARVYGPEPLSWAHRRAELTALGIADFLCDFQGRPYAPEEVGAVADAVRNGNRIPGTTEWSFLRVLR